MKTRIILLIIQFSFSINLISQINLDSLLVAYYPFNGNANDESGNGNNGTVNGAILSTDRFGEINSSYSFDGISAFIDFDDVYNDVFVPFAISLWVYKEQEGPQNQNIIKSDNSLELGGNYYGFWLTIVDNNSDATVAISYGDGGEPAPENRRTLNSFGLVPMNEWTHLVINVSGPEDMKIYFNSIYVGGIYSGSGDGMVHNDWPANMGKNTLTSSEVYFNGKLDDIRIYDRNLSAEEIDTLYEEQVNTYDFEITEQKDSDFNLYQNYPNPFSSVTNIRYYIAESSDLKLVIYNCFGQILKIVMNERCNPGNYVEIWDARDNSGYLLPDGIYFYQLKSELYCETRRMIVQR